MAMGDVVFVVECRCRKGEWVEQEFFDLYEDALDFAIAMQTENGWENRIIKHVNHKTKIVAVFKPMPKYELQKKRSSNIKKRMLDRALRIDSSDLQSELLIAVRTIEELEAEIGRLQQEAAKAKGEE